MKIEVRTRLIQILVALMAGKLKIILQVKLSSKVILKTNLRNKQKQDSNPKTWPKLKGVGTPQSARFLPPVFLSLGHLILSMAWWPLKSRCSTQWNNRRPVSATDYSDQNLTPKCLSHRCRDTRTNRAQVKAFWTSIINWFSQKNKHFPKLKHSLLAKQTFLGVKRRTQKNPVPNYKLIS